MKKISIILSSLILLFTSCDDKLDIVPTGDSTLSTVEDIEALLEQRWSFKSTTEYETLCGNSYPTINAKLPRILSNKNSTNYAYLTGDETVNRENLTTNDPGYTFAYMWINYANVVISKIYSVSGDNSQRDRINAEAHILRAWCHFIAANIFARQYDESTASTLGCVPYVDDTNAQIQKTKLTIREVYDRILADCSEEYISQLRQENVATPFRFGADFGYAARAMVLMQMKRYSEAKEYALKAIAINNNLEDRTKAVEAGQWILGYEEPNNYLLCYHAVIGSEWGKVMCTPELAAHIPDNDPLMILNQNGKKGWATVSVSNCPEGTLMCNASNAHYNTYGLRTENMYFLLAEVLIREGNIKEGMKYLDEIRDRRRVDNDLHYATSSEPLTEKQAMEILQIEKRLEMFTTIYNFFDRKRWNTESDYRKTIVNDCGDFGYFTIEPESALWVGTFPKKATDYNSSLTQNY